MKTQSCSERTAAKKNRSHGVSTLFNRGRGGVDVRHVKGEVKLVDKACRNRVGTVGVVVETVVETIAIL